MTERTQNVEAPFVKRRVQFTLVVIVSAVLVCLITPVWFAAPPAPHRPHSGNLRSGNLRTGNELASFDPQAIRIQIDLNAAEPRELALLPGVGPVLAKRIVEDRSRLGAFGSVADVSRVHGIGPKTLARIQEYCIVEVLPGDGYEVPRLTSTRGVRDSGSQQGSFDPGGR